jgi:hypothetical protein
MLLSIFFPDARYLPIFPMLGYCETFLGGEVFTNIYLQYQGSSQSQQRHLFESHFIEAIF